MALSFRGGNVGNAGTGATTYSVSLTALTGGASGTALTGDIVIVAMANHYPADGTGNMSITTTGYTELDGGGIYVSDSRDTNFRCWYKIMGATPDTTVALSDTNSGGDVSSVASVHVWTSVNTSTPMDVAVVPDSGNNTGVPSPAAITPITSGAIVLAIGAGSATSARTMTAPTGYSNLFYKSISQSSQVSTVGIASKAWSGSGAEDPADFGGMSTSTSDSWVALTIALRPAASGPANLKTYNTNAKANIKTINTNVIANVKTLDTNA